MAIAWGAIFQGAVVGGGGGGGVGQLFGGICPCGNCPRDLYASGPNYRKILNMARSSI